MRRAWALLIAVAVFTCQSSRSDAGLIINLVDGGGSAPVTTGTGTLASVMQAASEVWELAFNSPAFTHTLTLTFSWAVLTAPNLATHSIDVGGQGGTPHRETDGTIRFDNDDSAFFLDGTLDTSSLATLSGVASSSEFSGYTEATQNFGGGAINSRRTLSGGTGDAAGQIDAFSVALHEIGHALGMSSANLTYQADSWPDNFVDVAGSMPFVGSQIPTFNTGTSPPGGAGFVSNAHLNVTNALLFPSISSGIRRLPTAVDILANAQLSQFTSPNLDLLEAASVPEPSSLLLASIIGGCGFAFRVRRRRDTAGSKASAA